MERKKYVDPMLELYSFDSDDVLLTSVMGAEFDYDSTGWMGFD